MTGDFFVHDFISVHGLAIVNITKAAFDIEVSMEVQNGYNIYGQMT